LPSSSSSPSFPLISFSSSSFPLPCSFASFASSCFGSFASSSFFSSTCAFSPSFGSFGSFGSFASWSTNPYYTKQKKKTEINRKTKQKKNKR
jgi:hypothetical protein